MDRLTLRGVPFHAPTEDDATTEDDGPLYVVDEPELRTYAELMEARRTARSEQ